MLGSPFFTMPASSDATISRPRQRDERPVSDLGTALIRVRGARTHNLKNVDLDIPSNRLVVITGLSGSGKSSLAFDTLYAEGQRRYVESLSAYARQFLQLMDKPDVDVIEGLSPAISIEQKATSHNPRSTVGTVTEIHDYLRLLFARAGTPYCPNHDLPLQAQSVSQMVDATLALPPETRLMVLAPVVRDRKGEFVELFERDAGAGLRALSRRRPDLRRRRRAEAEEGREARHRRRHRPDQGPAGRGRRAGAAPLRQRLAESFEAALRIADGRAIAVEMDEGGAEHLYSSKFACPLCDYSLPELEPRLFSFNSPVGACPTCDGLGVTTVFDAERVVAFPSLSLASGAVKGWDRRNAYTFSLLESVATHYGFDIDTPFEELPAEAREVLLHGSGAVEIEFVYEAEAARGKQRSVKRKHPFEGILPNLERRFRETDSAAVREDLVALQSAKPCPDCHGTRLRVEARNVFLVDVASDEKEPIYRVEHFTLREALAWFERLTLPGAKAEIADKVIREICSRLKFLNDVGLNYLSLDRSAETLSGGEAQRIRLASQIGSGLTGVMYVLDEPSIGLHQRDNERLIGTLFHLRDIGNSVIVVEHDEEAIRAADHVIDMGPGAGVHGGRVMAQGRPEDVAAAPESLTGRYLSHALRIRCRSGARPPPEADWLRVAGARGNNLKQRRRRDPGRPLHLRHRRLGIGQVDAGQRHALRRGRQAPLQQPRRGRAARRHRGHRLLRQGDQRRPIADRPHAALQSGHLHRPVHADPRAVRRSAGGARARLRAGAVLASTSPAAAARRARATACSRSRCTSCPTSTCRATSATAGATTARRSRSSTRARTSPRC